MPQITILFLYEYLMHFCSIVPQYSGYYDHDYDDKYYNYAILVALLVLTIYFIILAVVQVIDAYTNHVATTQAKLTFMTDSIPNLFVLTLVIMLYLKENADYNTPDCIR